MNSSPSSMNPTVPGPGAPGPSSATPPRPRRRPRRWLPYAGGILLIALILAGLRSQPAPVEVAKASQGKLRATVNEEGRTRVRQRYLVSAPVSGQLRRIPFKAGAECQAGTTVVAIIDPISPALLDARSHRLAEARRDTIAANLEKARTAHRFATNDLARFQRLFGEGTVSTQELESFQWREAAAAKELAAAESALRQAEAELAEFALPSASDPVPSRKPVEVLAPATGRILNVLEENARVVAPGTPLLEIGDPTDLEVVIDVLSRDGAAIQPGAAIELDQWGAGKPLSARVRLIEPAAFTKVSALGVEEQRVNVIADLLTPADQRPSLGHGFRVEARIVVWESDNVLKVPSGALFRRGPNWNTFVLENGRAVRRSVDVGRASGSETQVLKGLQEGETVILYPGDRVTEGMRVQPVDLSR